MRSALLVTVTSLLVTVASLSLGACASGPRLVRVSMTREEVLTFGTARYRNQPGEVFGATVGALQALGYPVLTQEPEHGLIVTGTKVLAAGPVYTYFLGAPTVRRARQLVVRLFEDPRSGEVVVSALPKAFENGEDVSERPVWNLLEEREAWRELFAQIAALIGTGTRAPG